MGHIELLEGKTQPARNHFETAISLSSGKSIEVLDAVGFANADFDSKLGDANYAVEKLTQATNIKKFKDAKVMTDLGDAYRKLGDGGTAQRTYEAALAIDPTYARAKFRIGRIYQSQGPAQEAIYLRYYNEAIALDPNYTRVYWILHQYFYETDVVKSASYLDKYLAAKGTDETNACFLNAQMKFAQGLFPQTIVAADNCIASSANPYPNLYGLKAYAAYKLDDSVNAKTGFDLYFQKQKPEKLGSRDYETYAKVLLKFPGNEALAGTFIEKAVELDSTETGKVNLLKSIASIYESRKQYGEAADWYKKIVEIKKDPGKTDIYNAGIGYYRVGKYQQAIEMFNKYIEKYPEDIYGYYYKGSAQAGIDTAMTMGMAFPSCLKAAEVGETYPDKGRITSLIKGSYRYLIIFAANVLKNKDQALAYSDKAIAIDTADTEFKGFRESIAKMSPTAPKTYTNPQGEKVTIEADGSITTIGKDGSTTTITTGGKITKVKDGVTTIIENGKITTIDKDGKVISLGPGSKQNE
jgi:tetratricopeptide (TPR) repeat protein